MQKQFLNKDTLKQFISADRLNEAVKNLIFQINEFLDKNKNDFDYEPIRRLSDALIINSGKLSGLEHDKIIGILDRETLRITTAEIQNAVLQIIDRLPNQFWNYRNTTNELSHKTQLIESIELLHQQKTQFEYDIFICFSTKDREIAKPVWETLRGYGLRVFVSDEDLKSTVGFSFLDKIDFALSSSQHLVLLASENALNSVYVRDEYQAFYNDCHVKNPNNRLLIVFKLDNFQITELPRILRNKQIATNPEQIVLTLVNENLVKQKNLNRQQKDKQIAKTSLELESQKEKTQVKYVHKPLQVNNQIADSRQFFKSKKYKIIYWISILFLFPLLHRYILSYLPTHFFYKHSITSFLIIFFFTYLYSNSFRIKYFYTISAVLLIIPVYLSSMEFVKYFNLDGENILPTYYFIKDVTDFYKGVFFKGVCFAIISYTYIYCKRNKITHAMKNISLIISFFLLIISIIPELYYVIIDDTSIWAWVVKPPEKERLSFDISITLWFSILLSMIIIYLRLRLNKQKSC